LSNGATLSVKNNESVLKERPQLLYEKLKELKAHFDFVIIDAPSAAMAVESLEIMKISDIILFTMRANFSALSHVNNVDLIVEEYGLENIQIVLTDAHLASNYNGNLIGTRFNYHHKKQGFFARLGRYMSHYLGMFL